jgi:zinc transport system permease protein
MMMNACAVLYAAADINALDRLIESLTRLAPPGTFFSFTFNIYPLVALILVSITCGAVGSLVVGSRLAFFSDALAHSAFAGVSIGFISFALCIGRGQSSADLFWTWVTPIMVGFGVLVALGIGLVRNRTGLSSDTVIGVFFAGSIGLAAMLRRIFQSRQLFNLEDFLFGDPMNVRGSALLSLALLVPVTALVLCFIYNSLLLSSFNHSLALSRGLHVRLANYLFIVLLALIVNLCLRTVGALLINALLVVPGATAANISRNMRELFWWTVGLCVAVSVVGDVASWEIEVGRGVPVGIPGTIILLSVILFFLSMFAGARRVRPAEKEGIAPQPVKMS